MIANFREKRCPRCKRMFPGTVEFFHRNRTAKDGLSWWCKECKSKVPRSKNRSKVLEKYHKSVKGKQTAKKYRQTDKGKIVSRKGKLKNLYGLSSEDYNILFQKQKGCCAICGTHQKDLKRHLDVDHDHKTGDVRGLLCSGCNRNLGRFERGRRYIKKIADKMKIFKETG